MNDQLSHFFVGDEYAKVAHIKAGTCLAQHAHKFDHDSALLAGTVRVTVDGQEVVMKAPVLMTIKAHQIHLVTALTDCLWACLWSNPDGVTDPDEFDHRIIE